MRRHIRPSSKWPTHHTVKTYWLRRCGFTFTTWTHVSAFCLFLWGFQHSLVIGALECSFFARDTTTESEPTKIIVNVSTKLVFSLWPFWANHLIFAQIGRVIFAYSKQSDERKKATMITPFGFTLRLREKMMKRFLHKLCVCAFSIFGCYIFSSKYINVLRGKMGFHLDLCVCWILS